MAGPDPQWAVATAINIYGNSFLIIYTHIHKYKVGFKIHLLSERESSSRLAGPGPKWAIVPIISIYVEILLQLSTHIQSTITKYIH